MSSTDARVAPVERPRVIVTPIGWLRQNLFNGWVNSLITIILGIGIIRVLTLIADWVFTEATWTPIAQNLRLLMVGRYPPDEIWRVQFCLALIMVLFAVSGGIWGGLVRSLASGLTAAMVLLAIPPYSTAARLYFIGVAVLMALSFVAGLRLKPKLRWPVIGLWVASPFIIVLMVHGVGIPDLLPIVDTDFWGGLMLTLMLAVVAIVASFPLGILLALGRRSKLPIVKGFCVGYIELIRGVPLVTVLFMGSIMLPLFLPPGLRITHVVRAMVALTIFSSAYLAEYVRGGLQAVPRGQIEAARSLGLNVFQTTSFILLPQALRAVIPAIVGQFISLFKDTSLVYIIGLNELLGIANIVRNQPDWIQVTGGVQREVFLFAGVVYWVFSFTMARVSRHIEIKLGVGDR